MSLRIGDVVVLRDDLGVGVVRYVGSLKKKRMFVPMVGVELGTPIGNSDGKYEGKRHFNCAKNCGAFLERERIVKKLKPEDLLKKLNEVLESLEQQEKATEILENMVKEQDRKRKADDKTHREEKAKEDDKKDEKKKEKDGSEDEATKGDDKALSAPRKHRRMNSVSQFVVQKEKIESMSARVAQLEANNAALKDHLRLIAECTASLASINPFFSDLNDVPDVPFIDVEVPVAGAPLPNDQGVSPQKKMENGMFDELLNEVEIDDMTAANAKKGKRPSAMDVAKMDSIFRMSSIPRTPSLPAKVSGDSPKRSGGSVVPSANDSSSSSLEKTIIPSSRTTSSHKRHDRERGSMVFPRSKSEARENRSEAGGLRSSSVLRAMPGGTVSVDAPLTSKKRSMLERMSVDFDAKSMQSAGFLGDAFDDAEDYSEYQDPDAMENNLSRVATILTDHFFNYLDFTSDNMVDISNFLLAIRKFDIDETILSDHDLETLFRRMDTDRSGTIELTEFIEFLENPNPDAIALSLIEHLEIWDVRKEEELRNRRKSRRKILRQKSVDLRQKSIAFEKEIQMDLDALQIPQDGVGSPMVGPPPSFPASFGDAETHETMRYYFGRRLQEYFIPTKAPSDAELNALPENTLELNHVFGYKGNVLYRNNLHILRDLQNMVYNTANIVVLHNMKRNTQVHFTQHEKQVTAVAVWPDSSKNLIASGAAPNPKNKGVSMILVWDRKSRKVLRSFESDARGSVVALSFSNKFRMVYALCNDENHTIFGFTLNKGSSLPVMVAVASKNPIFGMAVNHQDTGNENETMIVFGKKILKYFDIWKEKNKKRVTYNYKWRQVRTSSHEDSVQEKAFHCCIFLVEKPSIYVVGGHTGHIYLCSKARLIHREPAHDAAVTVLTQTKRGFVSGSLDGVWQIWECDGIELKYLKKGRIAQSNPAVRNLGAPRSMCYDPSSGDLIVGCRTNQILKVSTMKSAKTDILVESHFDKVTCVEIHPTKNIIATGSADEYIRLWDLDIRKGIDNCSFHSSGEQVQSLGWAPDGQILAVGLATSAVLFFSDSLRPMGRHDFRLASNSCEVNALVWAPNSKLLALGFGSGDIIIVNIKANQNSNVSVHAWPKNLVMTSAVLDLQFSKDILYLRGFSKDYEMMCWKLERKKREWWLCKYKMDPDIEFFGKPIRAGWDMRGLYQHGYDGSSLTACAVSHNSKLCISGDRFGCVRLFNYPAVFPDAHVQFSAHSTIIMDACFSTTDEVVATVSADGTVMIWKIKKKELPKLTRAATTQDLRKLSDLMPGTTRKLTLDETEMRPPIRKSSTRICVWK